MAVIENENPTNPSDHFFMFGKISHNLNNDITGVFLGYEGYGNFIAVWEEEMRLEIKLEFQSRAYEMYYSLFDAKHLLKPYPKLFVSTGVHYREALKPKDNLYRAWVSNENSRDTYDIEFYEDNTHVINGVNIFLNPPNSCLLPILVNSLKQGR